MAKKIGVYSRYEISVWIITSIYGYCYVTPSSNTARQVIPWHEDVDSYK